MCVCVYIYIYTHVLSQILSFCLAEFLKDRSRLESSPQISRVFDKCLAPEEAEGQGLCVYVYIYIYIYIYVIMHYIVKLELGLGPQ